MLGDRRLFDDMARVASGAAGALGGIRSRVEGELRYQVERMLARMNLVTSGAQRQGGPGRPGGPAGCA